MRPAHTEVLIKLTGEILEPEYSRALQLWMASRSGAHITIPSCRSVRSGWGKSCGWGQAWTRVCTNRTVIAGNWDAENENTSATNQSPKHMVEESDLSLLSEVKSQAGTVSHLAMTLFL